MSANATNLTIGALRLMEPGSPSQHRGVSHVVKHWLNPAEYWDDLAISEIVQDPKLRPPAVAGRLAAAGDERPHTSEPRDPSAAVRAHWDELADVQTGGYDAVVQAAFDGRLDYFLASVSANGLGRRQGIRLPRDRQGAPGRVAVRLPGGIIAIGDLVLTPENEGASSTRSHMLKLISAYRPELARGVRFGQGAAGALAQKTRRDISEERATQHMLLLAQGGPTL